MNHHILSGVVLALFAATLGAQRPADEERSRPDLSRIEREKQQKAAEIDRLTDMRLRHDLGLPAEDDPTAPRPPGPVSTTNTARLQQECRDQEAATSLQLEEYNKVKAMVERLQAAAADRSAALEREESIVVPQAGTAQASQTRQAAEAVDTARPGPAAAIAKAPGAGAPAAVVGSVQDRLDPARGLINGSKDHLLVAQALFKAGQSLADAAGEARRQNRSEEAADRDKRAKERLLLALEELAPLVTEKEPPFAALFYQGRCRELLFRHAERYEGLSIGKTLKEFQKREQEVRDPFLSITARDVVKGGKRGEVETLGPWGLAAQSAIDHFRWMNEHGNYAPRTAISAITWPGEKDQ